MWSLSLHVRNLVPTVQARLQLIRHIGWEAELWFQRGGWHETADFWRCRMWWAQLVILGKAHCYGLCTSRPCFLQLLPTCTLVLWMLSEMKDLAQSAQTWPGLDLLSRPLDGLHGLMLLILLPGVASKRAVSAGQLFPFPGCQQELMGLRAQWTPFLCKRLARDAVVGPPFVPGRKMV